ncbi:outer membrane beta-barrel family protein [Flavobacterium hiemivividum]|uniref:TonB-dependent receptor n=1 Tax=Flavobacterium hiemivividum TaxID=2541734 RepID=A0A4R5CSY6_9FLAO|nr:outer membrane beta-barrel family protein [Flavobacterium hiemivividum]TDE03739.1 TonB-dependent receptor [Flavobacterium hiemivividum]
MTKTKFFLFITFIFISSNVFSQVSISGQVVNQNNKPVEFMEVYLQNIDSTITDSGLTTADGKFTILAEKGEYLLLVEQVGAILYKQKIDTKQDLNLGVIQVTEKQEQLNEVVVTSKKKLIERKVDRLVFNVENSIGASGGDAIDALKITPGIRVQNNAISMIGKSGMVVMIDDRLIQLSGDDLMSFLRTLSSENIKSIEVITTPPSKYSAEGNSGLVNIKLKKAKKDSWNASVNTAYRQATYLAGNSGGNFNYQKDKISIFSSTNIAKGTSSPIETSKMYYPNQLWANNSVRKDFTNLMGGRIGIDYQITNKLVMGIQYLGGNSKPNIEEKNLTTIYNNTNSINSFIRTNADNIRKNSSQSFNYHTIYNVDTLGTKIFTDIDYFKYNKNENRTFDSNSENVNGSTIPNSHISATNGSKTDFSNFSGKIDVEMPLKWASISYGGKMSFNNNNSSVSYYNMTNGSPIYDPNQSNQFSYKENLNALYFSGTKKIGKLWETQLGLRMETTNTVGVSKTLNEKNTNNYVKFFPTLYLIYNHSDNNSFSLNYSKRINRPSFNSLNPFRWYDNPYSYSEGNPFLQPSYSHNIELSFTHNQNLENKIYYSKTENGFSQLTTLDENTNIQATKYINFFDTEIIGISESYIYDKIKWWESVNSLDLSYNKSSSKILITNQNREGFNYYFSTNNTFNLNRKKTIVLNLNFWISPSGVDGLDKITESNQLDVAMKFFFFNKNLQLSVVGNDIFSSNRFTYISYTNNIKQEYKNYYDIRSFRLSLSYKFGSTKINVKKRNFGNEEEKRRTN